MDAAEVSSTQGPVTYTVLQKASQRGKPLLVESTGYSYTIKRQNKTSTEWRCSVRNKAVKCGATIKQTNVSTFLKGPIEHCHEYIPELLTTTKVKAKV